MATSAIALGQLARLAFANEPGAFGVAATTGFRYAHYYSFDMRETQPLESDPVIGSGFNNFRDATPPGPGLSSHEGSLVVPLCLNQIGDWLRLLFGAPTSTGPTNFQHVFASGAQSVPTYTIELNPVASDFRQHIAVAANGFSLNLADAAGFQRMTLNLIGYGESLFTTTQAGAPTAARTPDIMSAVSGEVLLGGTRIGVLLGADVSYAPGLAQERYVDGIGKFGAIVPVEQAMMTGSLRVRYTGPTFDNLAIAGTPQALEFRIVRGANNSLSIPMPAARLGRAGVAIEGPGGIEQTISFRAEQTSGAAMVGPVLRNQIASYTA